MTLYTSQAESDGNTYPVDASRVTLSVPLVSAWVATKLTRRLTSVAPASDDVAVNAVSVTDVPTAPAGVVVVAAVMPTPMAMAMTAHMKALTTLRAPSGRTDARPPLTLDTGPGAVIRRRRLPRRR